MAGSITKNLFTIGVVVLTLFNVVLGQTASPTRAPSTFRPTRKPTNKPIHIYGDEEPIFLTENEQQGLVATLTVLLFVLMAFDFTGPEVLFLIALMICCLAQILTITETLSGFSNESMITIATLFLVIGAVEKSHVVDWLARKTFGTGGVAWVGRLRMYITCFLLSIFFNNTPLVAILLPVVKDWGRMRGISASQLLIPLSYAVLAGSFGSMIGTSTNLTVQGLMEVDRGYAFPFFAPLPIGIVCFAALLVYMTIAGPYLLPNDKSGLLRKARDELKEYIAEVYVSSHSSAVGKSLEFMMNSIGVAPSYAVKIRRRGNVEKASNSDEPSGDSLRPSRSMSSFIDVDYLAESAKFWYEKPTIPDRLGDYSQAAQGEEDAATADPEKNTDKEYYDIIAPSFHETVQAGDIVFIASAQDAVEKMMKSILGESRGLYILKGNVMALPGFGSELVELVVSDSNPFVGQKVSDISADFGDKYKAALITVRPKDFGHLLSASSHTSKRDVESDSESKAQSETVVVAEEVGIELVDVSAKPADEQETVALEKEEEKAKAAEEELSRNAKALHAQVVVSDHVLRYGDTLLAVTNKKNIEELSHNRDFFIVSSVGKLPKPLDWYTMIPVIVFVAMLVCVASEIIDMCPAALTVTAFFFMGGWIKPQEIPKLVDVRLLMLMGTSLSFASAMTKSGLALKIASTINDSDPSDFGALMLVYVITLVITELISNNAAAALMYPISVALADELGASFKPFAMAVLIASTAGFMSPIGYQTHVMVWGPGGYSFRDFLIFGVMPDIIYWVVGCAITVQLYPF
eukprot:gene17052-12204_t